MAFEALFRERSVTKAGRRLGLSQPATSAVLARLRTALADELFVTTPRGLEPTARCAALAAPIAAALAQLQSALESGRTFDPATTDLAFNIGAVDAVLVVLLHGLAARFLQEAPRARLLLRSIDPREGPVLIDREEIELAVAPVVDPPAHLNTRDLFPISLVVASRHGHPLGKQPDLSELARYPHVLVSFAGPPRTAIDETFEGAGLRRHVAFVLSSFLAVPHLLETTDALAIVPEPFARELELSGRVRCTPLPVPLAGPRLRMRLLWPGRVHDSPAWQWLRDLIVEVVGARLSRSVPAT